jgi:hypothetical protein
MAKPALRSLIELPDDSAKPVLHAITSAKKSLRVKMFAFSDPSMLQALIDARHRVSSGKIGCTGEGVAVTCY